MNPTAAGSEGNEKNELLKYIREEAYAVRDCFTKYSVQIMAVSGGLLVAIAKFQIDDPYIGIISFFPVLLILLVLQMGVHKYATSNRLLGYELHVQRIAHYPSRDRCQHLMEIVGWEEGLRAWRIVQPTVWESIYQPDIPTSSSGSQTGVAPDAQAASPFSWRFITKIRMGIDNRITQFLGNWFSVFIDSNHLVRWLYPIVIRKSVEQKILSYPTSDESGASSSSGFWFDQTKAIERFRRDSATQNISYNAGGYLRTMMFLFFIAIIMCLSVPLIATVQLFFELFSAYTHLGLLHFSAKFIFNILFLSITAVGILAISAGWKNIDSRVRTLESGLLSIHSCAILWEAVILAHLRVLEELHFFNESYDGQRTMRGYTQLLAKEANDIAMNVENIHEWIIQSRANLEAKLAAS